MKNNTPILLANTEWMPPERLLNEVRAERMIQALCSIIKPEIEEQEVGDAEALAYMMPETGRKPLTSEWGDIYLYLAGCVLKRWKQWDVLPEECRVEKLDDYKMGKLRELKRWIYKSRGGKEVNPILTALKEVFLTDRKSRRMHET